VSKILRRRLGKRVRAERVMEEEGGMLMVLNQQKKRSWTLQRIF
jgi:hypothetical protein